MAFLRTRCLSLTASVFRACGERVGQGLTKTTWSRYRAIRCQQYRMNTSGAEVKKDEKTDSVALHLSDSCVQQLLQVTGGEDKNSMLRITVENGGCSGFQYKFELDNQVKADDKLFEMCGARVVVDDLSMTFLAGSTVDYHKELIRSSFRILANPNAELGCSCGVSFALK